MIALRDKVVATVDNSMDEAAADVTVICTDGRRLHVYVDHAIGSLENPMTDLLLEAKFDALVNPVLGSTKSRMLQNISWKLADQPNLLELASHAHP
ncbi:MAG: hypothetical protein ABI228_02695 [Burkholderiaceae bacterium]